MRHGLPIVVLALLSAATAARADEVIRTATPGAPPKAEAPAAPLGAASPNSPAAIGDWARGVIEGRPAIDEAKASQAQRSCPPSDGKPHGEIWGGIGTGGYREAGGVVTQPLGDCGHLTLGVNRGSLGGR